MQGTAGACGAAVTGGLKFSSVLGTELSLLLLLFILSKIMGFFPFIYICARVCAYVGGQRTVY